LIYTGPLKWFLKSCRRCGDEFRILNFFAKPIIKEGFDKEIFDVLILLMYSYEDDKF